MVFRARYAAPAVSLEKFSSTAPELLPAGDFLALDCGPAQRARRRLLDTEYDLVIINAPPAG